MLLPIRSAAGKFPQVVLILRRAILGEICGRVVQQLRTTVAIDGVVQKPWRPFRRQNSSRKFIPFSGGRAVPFGCRYGEVLQTAKSKINLSV
jgi:hypothetical protein